MTVTVGTNVYISVAGADTYWSERNNSTWSAATTAAKEKALREATQYIDGAYMFIGELTSLTQSLAWPRSGAVITSGNFRDKDFDSDEIPQKIEEACAELALEALSANLRPAEDRNVKREKVDVIEVEYLDFAPTYKTYAFVSMLLKGLVIGGSNSNSVKLVRV